MARLHEYQGEAISRLTDLRFRSSILNRLKPNSPEFMSTSRTPVHYRFTSFGASDASCWKRGSFRSGSNIGSSRSSAGVSGVVIAPLYGIESSFCKAAMARSASPARAVTRAKISRRFGPSIASFSIGFVIIARSARANAVALSPRAILIRARSPMRFLFSGCSLSKGSSSLRACRQLAGRGIVAGNFLRSVQRQTLDMQMKRGVHWRRGRASLGTQSTL